MGEAKRLKTNFERVMEDLTRKLTDEGKLIEAGWIALRMQALPPNTPPQQLGLLRWAYLAGAQHLFASIMGVLEEGSEPTATELKRLDLIAAELEAWRAEVAKQRPPSRILRP